MACCVLSAFLGPSYGRRRADTSNEFEERFGVLTAVLLNFKSDVTLRLVDWHISTDLLKNRNAFETSV